VRYRLQSASTFSHLRNQHVWQPVAYSGVSLEARKLFVATQKAQETNSPLEQHLPEREWPFFRARGFVSESQKEEL